MIVIIDSKPSDLQKLEVFANKFKEASIVKKFLNIDEAMTVLKENICEIVSLDILSLQTKTSVDIANYLIKYQPQAKLLIGYSNDADKELEVCKKLSTTFEIHWYRKPLSMMEMSEIFMSLAKETQPEIEGVVSSYIPIKINLFKKFENFPCDVYLQLSSKKLVKIGHKNDISFTPERLEDYKKKGIQSFHITQNDFTEIGESFFSSDIVVKNVRTSKEQFGFDITKGVVQLCLDIGINDQVITDIDQNIASLAAETKAPDLKNLLSLFNKNKGTVLYNHSYLTSVFAILICNDLSWNTAQIRKNLCMASMLHDLDLVDDKLVLEANESLSVINTFNKIDRQLILSHPHKMAEKLSKFNEVPSDVINMISKHHEGRGVDSYPAGIYAPNLAPSNCLFNTAHQFAIILYNLNFDFTKREEAFAKLQEIYPANNFKVMIDALRKNLH